MSNLLKWTDKTANWVWLALIPGFGGLAIVYAGNKVSNKTWIGLGIGITVAALMFASEEIAAFIWLFQVGIAFYLHRQFNLKSLTKNTLFDKSNFNKVDINICSKHELVYHLELPIVYANNIESLRNEGYIFTHLEELSEIAGLPESYLNKVASKVTFSYNPNQEIDVSWRRFNSYSKEDLINSGVDSSVAEKIVEERQKNGSYRSLIDVRTRTGISLKAYWDII